MAFLAPEVIIYINAFQQFITLIAGTPVCGPTPAVTHATPALILEEATVDGAFTHKAFWRPYEGNLGITAPSSTFSRGYMTLRMHAGHTKLRQFSHINM